MGNIFYLLNMSVAGIKNIKKEIRLEFYKKTVDHNFDPERYRVKAIYGENGSGKSALITAVKIFQDLIIDDNYLSDPNTQEFLDEIINKTTHTLRFSLEFLVDSVTIKAVYSYSVHLGKNSHGQYEIQYEILKSKSSNYPNNKFKTIYESQNGELINIDCTDTARENVVKKTINLLSSRTFMSMYLNLQEDSLLHENVEIPIVLSLIFAVTIKVYIAEEDQHELYFLRKKFKDSSLDNQKLLSDFFEYGDSFGGFSSVSAKFIDKKYFEKYKENVSQLTQFIKIFKPDLVSIDIDAKENGEQYVCDLNLNYGDYSINKEFESTGIRKLIRLFDCFTAASTVGIVFIDEMDSNINDVYLCKLIEYFMYYGKGQLCFTTHNLDPMSILKENRNSIDFLSSDNHLVSWTSRGNATPENCYKNGMIEDSPFNIDATDFVGIFGE